jgi:PAS domain S-box-containing protein
MKPARSTYEDVLKDLADFMTHLEKLYTKQKLTSREQRELEGILHSEKAKALREQRFRLLAENTSDLITLHNPSGTIKYISPAIKKITGYTPDEYKQFTVLENVYAVDVKHVKSNLAKLGSGRNEVTYEYRILNKNQKAVWVETKTKVLRDENKKVLYWISSTRDISDRKKAEEKLRESEEQFRTSVENMLDPFFIFSAIRDENGEIVDFKNKYVNKAGCEFHQMTKKEQLGKRMLELFPENKSNGLFEKYCKVVETEAPYIDNAIKSKIRSAQKYIEKVYDIRASKLKDGIVISCRDITEQKQIEREKKKVEKAISSAIYGFAMADSDGYINYVNDAFLHMWGYSDAMEVLGKHATDFWKDPYSAQKIIYQLDRNDGAYEELQAKKRDGTEFPVLIVANTFENEDKENHGLMASFVDITERKEAEQILRENEQKLKEKNIAKDKFLSIIAHDLKNPFNSIIGFSDLLLRNLDKDDSQPNNKQYAEIIYSEAKHTLDLLDNLLNWSRSQEGRLQYFPEKVDLRKLIMYTIKLMKYAANQKKIIINYQLDVNLKITADKNMLSTVIRNLVSNAIKFTKEGGKIEVIAIKENKEIKISVSDTGTGIKKKDIDKLFKIEEGFRTKGTKKEGGTGLGLLLCKEFVEKHNGQIWAESIYGKGSTFTFTIPFKQ